MIKVSDYIVKRLAERGIRQAFSVVGGGSMHLNDSFGRSEEISTLYNHHEQACAMAAEGYARVSGRPAVVVVTSGPGGTNALTGVLGQWLDSVPCIYLSGNMKRQTNLEGCLVKGLRQLGDQEAPIIEMVRPITKFSRMVWDPAEIGPLLDRAFEEATTGRPGPVWLDIPLDVQGAMIEEPHRDNGIPARLVPSDRDILAAAELLLAAERPLLLAGHGVSISRSQWRFLELAEWLKIPVVTGMNGMDLISTDHPLYAGRIGTQGTRCGNRALAECDLLISIGSRNNIRQISYNWQDFAPKAKKIVVDIDDAELRKPTLRPDLPVLSDAAAFISSLRRKLESARLPDWNRWTEKATGRMSADWPEGENGPYCFIEDLTDALPYDAIIVTGNGTASVCTMQAAMVKPGQRYIMNSGCASMGYDLPAAIGACLASGGRPVVLVTGDGSIMMNIQELQTIAANKLDIRIIVLDNGGYHSIRQTQDRYFEGRHAGDAKLPDLHLIGHAFGVFIEVVELGREYVFDKLKLREHDHVA